MTGLLSKRQQARNEKLLQDLLKSVPGNDRCADCGTKNPGWASWSLGIFICMSCAALHRKMGTHISKVKSLSMDSWSNEQVDNMKKTGNIMSNKRYNPGNTKPDIPIDADEVGGAMERFIRRKYELREFSGGMGRRATINHTGGASISSADDPPPPLPPKPGKKFGLALRSASATFSRPKLDKYAPPMSPPLSGSDGRESPPARMNKASRVFGSTIGNTQDDAFKTKMTSLREMGFHDAERNAIVLKEMNGSLAGAVETLVRLGEGTKPVSRAMTPVSAGSGSLGGLTIEKRRPSELPPQAPPKDALDPFAILDNETQPTQRSFTQPVPQHLHAQPQAQSAYNPFYSMAPPDQPPQQTTTTLQDSFAGMRLSSAPPLQHNYAQPMQSQNTNNPYMTAPQHSQMQPAPQHYHSQNPYAQPLQSQHTAQPLQPQHTARSASSQQASNPFLRATKSQTFSHTQPNPFMQQMTSQNPWLVSQAPVASPQPLQTPTYTAQGQQPDFFNAQPLQHQNGQAQVQSNYALPSGSNPYHTQNVPHQPQQQQYQQYQQSQQQQQHQQQYQQQQQQQQIQHQSQSHNPYQQSYQSVPETQQSAPQHGRYDRASILQLYNYPQLAPSRPLQALPEETATQQAAAVAPQSNVTSPGRSATMPVTGNMNPFMSGTNGQAAVPSAYNHTSRDSMAFVGVRSGSPDAFASLSAHYGR